MKNPSKLNESKMLNAWLWDKHREDLQWRRVRLGPIPTKEMARVYMTLLRWADAVVIKDGVVNIIEAKIRPAPGVISQLELYKKLFPNTLEFTEYKDWPIQMIILSSMPDLAIAEMASEKDIEFEIFTLEDVNRVHREQMKPVLLE